MSEDYRIVDARPIDDRYPLIELWHHESLLLYMQKTETADVRIFFGAAIARHEVDANVFEEWFTRVLDLARKSTDEGETA